MKTLFIATLGVATLWILLPLPIIPPKIGSYHPLISMTVMGLAILLMALRIDESFRRPR